MTQEEKKHIWDRFIEHLNKVQSLPKNAVHKNFFGSIESYRKIFSDSLN